MFRLHSFAAVLVAACIVGGSSAAEEPATRLAAGSSISADSSSAAVNRALAQAFAQLLENSIPVEYERKKDWGKQKRITSGLRFDDFDIKRRHREVNHGVWKHYKVKLRNPEEKLQVEVTELRLVSGNQFGFTIQMTADLDLWARAKVYEYGIYLGSYETTGRTSMKLSFSATVAVDLEQRGLLPSVKIDPEVQQASFDLIDFRIKRISNAHGPIVKELSKTVEKAIEGELAGPKLVKKINRSIDKKRAQLVFSPQELLGTSWWPVAELPDVAPIVRR